MGTDIDIPLLLIEETAKQGDQYDAEYVLHYFSFERMACRCAMHRYRMSLVFGQLSAWF
jgi:hypothetical protein